ncbi:MAG: hypothetical protein A3E87_08835 [Gammaproteobacteria bacterium RIFCSPHIGHO2_12_FULL_35_23]|nr:MAG: hypothetical protein A3E87_08835 [Gammaproteobacteria bacterium RIFCSPHIGHO2_12_FULL_35_23]
MIKATTLRAMIGHLLQTSGYTLATIARQIGVHEGTMRKLQANEKYQLIPAKQLALIKLYCSKQEVKQH